MTSEGGGVARREHKHCCTLSSLKKAERNRQMDKPEIQSRVK